jgi:ribonuclease BN (tRNA processing enzyme)
MSNSQKLQVAEDLVKEAANLLTKHIEANADDKAMYRALNNAPKDYSDETKKAAIKLAKSNKVKTIPNVNTIPSGKTFSDQTKAVGFSEADIRENAGQEMSNSQKLQVAEDLVKEAANLLTKHIEVNADDNAMYIALSNAPKDYSDETKKAAIELAKSNKVKAMPNVKTLPSGKTFSDRAKAVGLSEAGIRENAAELGMDPEDYLRMCEQ